MSLTSDFYDSDPEGYFDRTFGADMSDARSRFVACLDPGASILDLGCGSCRDTVAFRDAGFDVTPADGSEGMRRVVRERLGIEVVPVDIADMRLGRTFDGIWACASLLHVPSAELPGVMRSIRAMLRPGGAFFCCFKLGTFEGIRDGRFYTDLTEEGLRILLGDAGFTVRETWVSDGDGCRWVNAISAHDTVETTKTV
ncbi:MAG: class I SAM-dependent methyltransferase [Thermoplasmata archaeon]|nr:class I SAM-dependent methyltransferase [Thermoplasmata archaeon]